MKTLKISILYQDGANFKSYFDHEIDLIKFPKAIHLKIGDEFKMGKYGTLSKKDWFTDGDFDPEFDHNILEVAGIEHEATINNTEKVYIEYLNKDKGFKKDRIEFNSYQEAVIWARENLEKFDPDMIKYC